MEPSVKEFLESASPDQLKTTLALLLDQPENATNIATALVLSLCVFYNQHEMSLERCLSMFDLEKARQMLGLPTSSEESTNGDDKDR